jgi:uncharacterized protein with PQ loop repeat
MIEKIALVAAIILPLWNLPFIFRIVRRKSSQDVSLYWAVGVWSCFVLMAPSGFTSEDLVWRVFNIANLSLFTLVLIFVLAYRKSRHEKEEKS